MKPGLIPGIIQKNWVKGQTFTESGSWNKALPKGDVLVGLLLRLAGVSTVTSGTLTVQNCGVERLFGNLTLSGDRADGGPGLKLGNIPLMAFAMAQQYLLGRVNSRDEVEASGSAQTFASLVFIPLGYPRCMPGERHSIALDTSKYSSAIDVKLEHGKYWNSVVGDKVSAYASTAVVAVTATFDIDYLYLNPDDIDRAHRWGDIAYEYFAPVETGANQFEVDIQNRGRQLLTFMETVTRDANAAETRVNTVFNGDVLFKRGTTEINKPRAAILRDSNLTDPAAYTGLTAPPTGFYVFDWTRDGDLMSGLKIGTKGDQLTVAPENASATALSATDVMARLLQIATV